MTKLYVGNLPYSFTEEDIKKLFAEYPSLTNVTLITDRASGRSKGFGFAEIDNDEEAGKAIEALNGKDVDGRSLVVNVARPKEDRPNRNFGGGNRY